MNLRTLLRRLVTIPVVGIALPLALLTAPIWVPVTILVDVVGRLPRLPTLRLGLFGVIYLIHEWLGLGAAFCIWVVQLFDRRKDRELERTRPYRAVQGWWATSLLAWAGRLLGVRFDLGDTSTLPSAGFILKSRHASMVDAILPVMVVAGRMDRFVHYVIKQELQWDPTLDVFGHRLGNYFVARSGDSDAETAAIEQFAERALPGSTLVIFPEGTYATEANRRRITASIERTGQADLVAYAAGLTHLLPPKPAGSMALLSAQPDHDVVIFGHVGLEGVAQLGGLRRRLPLTDPVVVRWWVHERTTVPDGQPAQVDWLNRQWQELDAWVLSIARSRSQTR